MINITIIFFFYNFLVSHYFPQQFGNTQIIFVRPFILFRMNIYFYGKNPLPVSRLKYERVGIWFSIIKKNHWYFTVCQTNDVQWFFKPKIDWWIESTFVRWTYFSTVLCICRTRYVRVWMAAASYYPAVITVPTQSRIIVFRSLVIPRAFRTFYILQQIFVNNMRHWWGRGEREKKVIITIIKVHAGTCNVTRYINRIISMDLRPCTRSNDKFFSKETS